MSTSIPRNFHDCFDPTDQMHRVRLFGNANIGYYPKSNLQVPFQPVHGDGPFTLTNWYARSNVPWPLLAEWAHMAYAELVIGEYVQQNATLHELFHRAPGPAPTGSDRPMEDRIAALEKRVEQLEVGQRPILAVVPVRQTAYVVADRPGGEIAQRLVERLRDVKIAPGPLIWIHLEGISGRIVV